MLCVATMGMHLGWRERAKNFSSPLGSFSPDGGEVLVLVADEEDLSEILARGWLLDLRDAVQDSALEVELHHDADGLGQILG